MSGRRWLNTTVDAAEALAENPPDIPGWEHLGIGEVVDRESVRYALEDDDGASVWLTIKVTDVELDERRVEPDPLEREKGDDGRC